MSMPGRHGGLFERDIESLQQEIILSGETLSTTRLLFWYTKALSNSDKIKAFIAPKMKYLIKFLDNNGKSAVFKGVYINGLYHYLESTG